MQLKESVGPTSPKIAPQKAHPLLRNSSSGRTVGLQPINTSSSLVFRSMFKNLNDGTKHSLISVALAVPSAALGLVLGDWVGAFSCCVGCLSGIILSPDLDQETLTTSETIFLKIPFVGWIGTAVMFALFLPYAIMFKHRGVSHWPLIGTITRVLYLGLFAIIAYLCWNVNLVKPVLPYLPLWFLGLVISDCGHFLRDYVVSGGHL